MKDRIMVDRRFDNRTKAQFKKDIKFGTRLESYFFQGWVERMGPAIYKWDDNGVDNDGEYVESGKNTAGADYRVTAYLDGYLWESMPLEVKWVPTAGKFTMKIADVKAYVAEDAGILFIYNNNPKVRDLRKPKDHDFDKHVRRIEQSVESIRWGVMHPSKVEEMYDYYVDKCYPISYMGNKMGFIIPSDEFGNWFTENEW